MPIPYGFVGREIIRDDDPHHSTSGRVKSEESFCWRERLNECTVSLTASGSERRLPLI